MLLHVKHLVYNSWLRVVYLVMVVIILIIRQRGMIIIIAIMVLVIVIEGLLFVSYSSKYFASINTCSPHDNPVR